MAKGKKTGGNDFKPGNTMGKGAAHHSPEAKVIRRMSKADVAEVGQLILEGNLTKLQAVKDDRNASVLKVWMCSVAIRAIGKGDAAALNALLDRIVGKCDTTIQLTGAGGGPVKLAFTDEQKRKIAQAYLDE